MKNLRLRAVALVIWLFLLYNIERMSEPINIASFVYVLVAVEAAGILLLSVRVTPGLSLIGFTGLVALYLLTKSFLGYRITGSHLSLTVTEIAVLGITALLTHMLKSSLNEFESAVEHISIDQVGMRVLSKWQGQEVMHKEIRRARRYSRPFTLLALKIDQKTIQVALHRMVEEVQRAMMERFLLVGIARALNFNLRESDVIVQQDGHFLIMLPETTPEQTPNLIARLQYLVQNRLGATISAGAVGFPDEAVTLAGLQELAEQKAGMSAKTGIAEQPTIPSQADTQAP